MNFSPTNPRISRQGFTLVEMVVSAAVLGIASLIAVGMLGSGLRLASQNTSINVSNFRARQALDRLEALTRYAEDQPELIDTSGAVVSGSNADGILVENTLGGPYVFKDSTGSATNDIASTATSFTVEYIPTNGIPAPRVGDWFIIETSTRPELQIASVAAQTVSGSLRKNVITTTQAIGEAVSPGSYRVPGYLYRKEAYVFNTANGQTDLRRYPRVTAGMNYSSAANYVTLGSGFQKLNSQPFFQRVTINGLPAIQMQTVARASAGNLYAEKMSKKKSLTTMALNVNLWNAGR